MSGYGFHIRPEILKLGLSPIEVFILALTDYETSLTGYCSCTNQQFGRLARVCTKSVSRAIAKLSALGHIEISSGNGGGTRILISQVSASSSASHSRGGVHIYLIHNPVMCRYKIGITKNLNSRLRDLAMGSGMELDLLASHKHHEARALESYIHNALAERRTMGEWFDLGPDTRAAIDLFEGLVGQYDSARLAEGEDNE